MEPKKILVVKLRTLGDILTTFPLLRALKEIFPLAHVTVISDDSYGEVITPNPRVDAFWEHPAKALRSRGAVFACRQQWGMIRRIRQERFDLYLDLYGSMRTALWGCWGRIPRRMGFHLRGRKYFYTDTIRAAHRYVVDLNLQFARVLGWQGNDNAMEFFLGSQDEAAAQAFLHTQGWERGRPYAVCSPGGGWPLKRWDPERFGKVLKILADKTGCQLVLTGSPEEAPIMEVCARASSYPVVRAVGLPLCQVAAIIKNSRLFLGNDSGPKYFAESYRVPTVICYGPTDFRNNNPDTPRHRVVCRDLPCRPCHTEKCRESRRMCLDDIQVEDVVSEALKLWVL
ncbi:glycosyltransferase family 9 protein [candidate division FCPU426 bacterium]|nr:glycosyltransferase family 9 protein [candidate division FCPU426 bacterium]